MKNQEVLDYLKTKVGEKSLWSQVRKNLNISEDEGNDILNFLHYSNEVCMSITSGNKLIVKLTPKPN